MTRLGVCWVFFEKPPRSRPRRDQHGRRCAKFDPHPELEVRGTAVRCSAWAESAAARGPPPFEAAGGASQLQLGLLRRKEESSPRHEAIRAAYPKDAWQETMSDLTCC